jgi:hypothetical protein
MKISLLHATRGTPDRANATRESWLSRASDRSMIEHFWATQAGDTTSTALDPDSIVAVTDDPPAWASSSVANWNAAAALATGDLLVVIADDLTPRLDGTRRYAFSSAIRTRPRRSSAFTSPTNFPTTACYVTLSCLALFISAAASCSTPTTTAYFVTTT